MKAPKRIKGSIVRSRIAWAWEFLRRNPHYRKGYHWWKDGKDDERPPDQELSDYLTGELQRAGAWRLRFTPWMNSVIESGRPFAIPLVCIEHHGTWIVLNTEDDAIAPDEMASVHDYGVHLGAEPRLILCADRLLDPMMFCLNRWLNPADASEVIGEDVLAKTFDVSAITTPNSVEVGSDEAKALRNLGLLTFVDLGGRVDLIAHPEHALVRTTPLPGSDSPPPATEWGRARLNIEFDVLAPLAPQLMKAQQSLERLRTSMADAPGDPLGELKDVKLHDQGGVYTRYLRMLDQLPPEDQITNKQELYRSFCADPLMPGLTPESAEKAFQQAELLRDGGYRSLAFSR